MKKRVLTIGIIITIAAAAAIGLFRRSSSTADRQEAPVDQNVVEITQEAQRSSKIVVAEVEEHPLADEIELTGVVAPDEARVGHILPLAQGVVDKIYVQLGDRVEKSQPLLQFDNVELGELTAQHLRMTARLNTAKAKLAVARRSLERAEHLLEVEGISQREYDQRKAEYEEAEAEMASERAELLQIEQKLHRFGLTDEAIDKLKEQANSTTQALPHNTIRSPFAGVITKFSVAPGELITPGKEVFTVVDPSSVWVVADVYQGDIGRIARQGPCDARVSGYPNDTFKGTIGNVSEFLDPESRTAKLRCVVSNRDGRLKLDMFAVVTIPSARPRKALVVPSSAVQRVENVEVVFVQRDETHFERRPVEVGATAGPWVEIKSGLRKGEKVASEGAFYLKSVFLKEELKGEE